MNDKIYVVLRSSVCVCVCAKTIFRHEPSPMRGHWSNEHTSGTTLVQCVHLITATIVPMIILL